MNGRKQARRKGSGTLQLRGGRWLAIWTVNGKRYTKSTGTGDRKEAEKKLAEFVKPFQEKTELEIAENLAAKVRVKAAAVRNSRNGKARPVKILEMVDVYREDLSTSRIEEQTAEQYEAKVRALAKKTGLTFAYEVGRAEAEKFMEGVKSKACAGTFNIYLVSLKAMYNAAMKKDYRIRENPFDGISKLREDRSRGRRELSNAEVSKLISCAAEISKDIGDLFVMGAYTGMRKSDICNLKRSSVDEKNGVLKFRPLKTKKNGLTAVVKIHEKVRAVLDSAAKDGEYVFPRLKAMYDGRTLESKINAVFKAAGIETHAKDGEGKTTVVTGFHALRVYFATNCARSGMPVNQIMKTLGHSKADMTLHYVETPDADVSLPDFDSDTVKVPLRKEVAEILKKKAAGKDLSDFVVELLAGKIARSPDEELRRLEQEAVERMVDSL